MTLERRMQALLDLVESDRAQRCAEVIEQARTQARSALAQARAQARAQMREVFAEERERAATRVAAAQADLQTRRRLALQHREEALLALAWQRLPAALQARWRDTALRQRWIEAALQAARTALPAGCWTISHAPDWPAGEAAAFAERVQSHAGQAPLLRSDSAIPAGLRLAADGNAIDATLAGLLADRDEIGGRLIGLLDAAVATASTGAGR
jgi:hypothetical protein